MIVGYDLCVEAERVTAVLFAGYERDGSKCKDGIYPNLSIRIDGVGEYVSSKTFSSKIINVKIPEFRNTDIDLANAWLEHYTHLVNEYLNSSDPKKQVGDTTK